MKSEHFDQIIHYNSDNWWDLGNTDRCVRWVNFSFFDFLLFHETVFWDFVNIQLFIFIHSYV